MASTSDVVMTTKNPSLPHEVVIDILSRLPATYLWTLRCVSKTWLQLLTTDHLFPKLHLHRSIQLNINPSILAESKNCNICLATEYTNCDEAIELELPSYLGSKDYNFLATCNGLICFTPIEKNEIGIWNPLTRGHITIPYSPNPSYGSHEEIGIGFHRSSNEFKVIRVDGKTDYTTKDFHSQVNMYTIGIDSSWRILEEDIPYDLSFRYTIHVNGMLYWHAFCTGSTSFVILSLDLKDECFREIPPPKDFNCDNHPTKYAIGELGGFLCVLNTDVDTDVEIWTMKEYGGVNSWTKQFRIERPEIFGFSFFVAPLGITPNGELILNKNHKELVLYNPETNSIRDLKHFDSGFVICRIHHFKGSIISPRVISGAGNMVI